MGFKERLAEEREIKKNWNKIKEKIESLTDILLCKKDLEEFDYVLLFQCTNIVLENLLFYEDEFKNSPGQFNELKEGVEYLLTSDDEEKSVAERLEALEKIRLSSWKRFLSKKDEILKASDGFPDDVSQKDLIVAFKCISMVILELDMKEREVNILETLKFE